MRYNAQTRETGLQAGHNYLGHNYLDHNYLDHNYLGHNYLGHHYLGPHLGLVSAITAYTITI